MNLFYFKILKFLWFFFDKLKFYHFHVFFISLFISDFNRNNKKNFKHFRQDQKKLITILVLDHQRFRGDLKLFVKYRHFRILTISWTLLKYMLAFYVKEPTIFEKRNNDLGSGFRSKFRMAKAGSKIYQGRLNYQHILRKIIPKLYTKFGIKIIINTDHRYRREADICKISSELGYKHICFYRESMYIVKALYNGVVQRHNEFGQFTGDIIAVQNEITKKMFLESKMTSLDKIIVRGCPRMDNFIKNINKQNKMENKKTKQITFFSCPKGGNLENGEYISFFENSKSVIETLSELCKKNKNIKLVIKMKDLHINQLKDFERIVEKVFETKTSYQVIFETRNMASHDVILSSDIVVAMQSTVVLEAGISGLPVILPHFEKIRKVKRVKELLMYTEYYDLFDVPNDPDDLKKMIENRLIDNNISSKVMKKRQEIFEKFVSPLYVNATQKSINLIKNVIKK